MKIEKLLSKNVTEGPFTKITLFDNKSMLISELTLKNGDEIPPCEHKDSSFLLYITNGMGKITASDKETQVQEGDFICLDKDEVISIKSNSPQGLSCLQIITPRPPIKEQYNELGI